MVDEVQLPPDSVLLISGFEPPGREFTTPGGLFVYDGRNLTQLDSESTGGLCYVDDRFLARGIRNKERDTTPSDIVIHAPGGSQRFSLPDVANLHDVCWMDNHFVVVSTAQNRLVWIDPYTGKIVRQWQPEGEPDSWHLNSLIVHQGRLLVSCFGRFTKTREWLQTGLEAGTRDSSNPPATGCLIEVESDKTMLNNLQTPHSPRFVDQSWILCESLHRRLVQRAGDGMELRQTDIGGWTRGLALTDDYIFVGVSRWFAHRPTDQPAPPADETARIVVLDRRTWKIVTTIPLPTLHIYDVIVVPKRVLEWIIRSHLK